MLGIAPLGASPIGAFRFVAVTTNNYSLSLDEGIYTLTGAAVTTSVADPLLGVVPGSYEITGTDLSARYARIIDLYGELVPNNAFDVDPTDWTTGGTGVTFTSVAGQGQLYVPGNTVGYAYLALDVIEGCEYRLAVDFGSSINTTGEVAVRTAPDGGSIAGVDNSVSSNRQVTFIAPASTVYLVVFHFNRVITVGSSALPKTVNVNLVSLQQAGDLQVAGGELTTVIGHPVAVASAEYVVTGDAPALIYHRIFDVPEGSVSYSPAPVDLYFGHRAKIISGIYRIVGTPLTTDHGGTLDPAAGMYELTGAAVTLTYYSPAKLTIDAGEYALGGSAATLLYARIMPLAPGTYPLQGRSQSLIYGRNVSLDAGDYSYDPIETVLIDGSRTVGVTLGIYRLSGSALSLKVARTTTFDAGTYAITGAAAQIHAGWYAGMSGTYALSPADATITAGRLVDADAGEIIYTGSAGTITYGHPVKLGQGLYLFNPLDVVVDAGHSRHAASGTYTLLPTAVSLVFVRTTGGPRVISAGGAAQRRAVVDSQLRKVSVNSQVRKVAVPPLVRVL